jgi:sulfatase modifying factor 1
MERRSWKMLLAACALSCGACNDILGLSPGEPFPSGTEAGGGGAGAGGQTGGSAGSTGGTGGTGGQTTGTGAMNGGSGQPSCTGMASTCGAEGNLDCCESIFITGYKFPMGRSDTGPDAFPAGKVWEQPEHDATVSDFYLDRFEVTVGRFRKFLEAYDGTPPAPGSGEHPLIAGSGWLPEWDAEVLAKADLMAQLHCHPLTTWTDAPGANENLPMTCAKWYEMFQFCQWDGGHRLPTEAEWEYAAAGALSNSLYPWGSDAPDGTRAIFDCAWGGTPGTCEANDMAPVGSAPGGDSKQGIRDLAGSVWEYTLDKYSDVWYSQGGNTCVDCANLDQPTTMGRTIRGGAFDTPAAELRAVRRDSIIPTYRAQYLGWRCARSR